MRACVCVCVLCVFVKFNYSVKFPLSQAASVHLDSDSEGQCIQSSRTTIGKVWRRCPTDGWSVRVENRQLQRAVSCTVSWTFRGCFSVGVSVPQSIIGLVLIGLPGRTSRTAQSLSMIQLQRAFTFPFAPVAALLPTGKNRHDIICQAMRFDVASAACVGCLCACHKCMQETCILAHTRIKSTSATERNSQLAQSQGAIRTRLRDALAIGYIQHDLGGHKTQNSFNAWCPSPRGNC